MKVEHTALHGVLLLSPTRHDDERGWFVESFSVPAFDAVLRGAGLPLAGAFVQDNHSCSAAGVLRGLHYQLPPHAQGKLVRVLRGVSWHVAVDLRRSSPHFARWVGVELTGEQQLWIPPGFAHGFIALADGTEVTYKATALYARDAERAIVWNDAALAIRWPAAPRALSARDAQAPRLADAPTFA
jgi:dTDP-4-dehydrorhamnose 3,5-epimerase